MKEEIDIHNHKRQLVNELQRIENSPLSVSNKKFLLEFRDHMGLKNIGLPRIVKYVACMRRFGLTLGKDYDEASEDDIKGLVRDMQECGKYTAVTMSVRKSMLKGFYKWLRGTGQYPPEVAWINTSVKRTDRRLPSNSDLLTEQEVKKVIDVCEHPKPRALLALLFETGARVGELGALRIKSIVFDEYGAVLQLRGKTGERRIRVISSTPYLMNWLDCHPFKDEPDSPLWVINGGTSRKAMTYSGLRDLITSKFTKAGVNKKCNPHLFRHSRATFLADHLTDAQMKQYLGWVQGSAMSAVYVHMSGKNLDAPILALNGIKKVEKETAKPAICPRCSTINVAGAKFCCKCAGILDVAAAMELEKTEASRSKVDAAMDLLAKDPEFMKMIAEKVKGLDVGG